MASPLPGDILELIIEEIGQHPELSARHSLLACCLAAKCFVAHSQKALFRSIYITLRLVRRDPFRGTRHGVDFPSHYIHPKTLSLVRVVNSSPHLVQHTRKVTMQICWSRRHAYPQVGGSLEEVARALSVFPDIRDFTLSGSWDKHPMVRREPYGVSMPKELQLGIASMMKGQQLERFALVDIRGLPLDLLLNASSLKELHLDRSSVTPDEESEDAPRVRNPPIQYLRSLHCVDWMAHEIANELLKVGAESGRGGLQLQRVEALDMAICFRSGAPKLDILAHVECLRRLHLTLSVGCEEDGPFIPHLNSVNPKSFLTLSDVMVDLAFTIYPANDAVDRTIADPYMSFCDSFLGQLHHLETLGIIIHLQGYHRLLPESFNGPRWGRLADVLGGPGAFPRLRRVGVVINIRMIDMPPYKTKWPTEEQEQDAAQLHHDLERMVRPQLERLNNIEIGGRPLDFSLTIRTTTEGFVRT